jgi:hypothetical protein
MILDSLTNFTLYHNGHENHNKVWGYFSHGDHWWAFWGGIGRAWNFKYHGADEIISRIHLQELVSSKNKKGYSIIQDLTAIDALDSTWRARFNERFTYFLLQQPQT